MWTHSKPVLLHLHKQLMHLPYWFLKKYKDTIQGPAAAFIFCRILFLKTLGFHGSLAEFLQTCLQSQEQD